MSRKNVFKVQNRMDGRGISQKSGLFHATLPQKNLRHDAWGQALRTLPPVHKALMDASPHDDFKTSVPPSAPKAPPERSLSFA